MSLQFFVADDGTTGQELWVTDGTAVGTFRLRDINPGMGNANIGNLIQSNGIMYFTAYDGISYRMWRTDGTAAGTYALTSPSNGDNAANLINVNGRLFFTGSDSVHGAGLFVTDGTTGGTQFVAAVTNPSQFVTVGNSLFFVAYDAAHGYELWKSDGTSAGTSIVSDILSGSGSSTYGNFTALDGKLYFTANDGVHGTEVWVSDGTAAGTFQLKDINLGGNGSNAGNFFAANGHVFFTANDGAHGTQYWSTDGTSAGTIVMTLSTGQSPTPAPGTQIVFNHTYYYVGTDPAGGQAIYSSDGTMLTKQVHLGSFSGKFYNIGSQLVFFGDDGTHGGGLYSFDGTGVTFVSAVPGGFSQPVVSNGHLFFVSYDATHGSELWVTDGTPGGTHITADINPGAYDAQITNISAVGTGVAFTAYRPDVGYELFFSDGTASGTGLLSNVNPTGDHSPSIAFGSQVVQAGSLGFFAANDGIHGYELWVTDGTAGGSRMVTDQVFGGIGAGPQNLFEAGGHIFFTADDGVNGRQVYTSDGTTITQLTSSNLNQPYNDGGRFFSLGGKFYFMAYDPAGGFNLVGSDGTVAGTQVVGHFGFDTPLHVGDHMVLRGDDGVHGSGLYSFDGTTLGFIANPGNFDNVTVSGSRVFWRGYDGANGYELWVSDGTAAGTHLVKDINPGPYDANLSNVIGLGNGSVVFTAYNPSTGNELYVSDGTTAGTMLLSDINATGNHGQSLNFNSSLVTAGSLTFFAAEDGIHGNELWVTDGTTGNTHMVADLVVGGSSSSPSGFFSAGGHIFFTADDGVNGRQVYTSDGTTITQLTSSNLNQPYNDGGRFFSLGGKFYFMAYDPAGGFNLVGSDGTVAGTQVVGHFGFDTPLHVGDHMVLRGDDGVHGSGLYSFDGTTLGFIANPGNFDNVTVSGSRVFWRGYDGANGYELWVSDGTAAGTHLVKDINPGPYDANLSNVIGLGNGSVVFTAYNPSTGNELYVSDGTTAGTMLLSDINATGNHGQSLNFNSSPVTAGSLTFFAAEDGIHGNELWVTDGTTGNTHMVADLVVGGSSSSPSGFFSAGGHIFFTADDGVNGRQVYTSDGTTITQLTSSNLNQPYNDGGRFFSLGGKFYFMAYDPAGGFALWGSDGTLAGTQRVSHITYDTPIALGAVMILRGNDDVHGNGLYSFGGAGAPTLIANINNFENATVSGGNLFFRSGDGGDGYELWVTDGTSAGTHEVRDINPGGAWSYPTQITSLGNGSVVFTADDGSHGSEIWVSDGTSAGTTMLSDLFPGGIGSGPDRLIKVGHQVFFTANYFSSADGAHGTELFVTDGTAAGTQMVRDINPGSDGTTFGSFFSFGGKLYFAAYQNGWHTYVTDGTDAGTHIIAPGDGSSTGGAGNFIAADATHFYFTGDSGLFYSDGTDAGTINIGSSRGFDINTTTVANGHLLYRLYDDTNGSELWTTDGTSAGTHRVTDTLIPNSSNATGFVFSGGKVYFYADDGAHGGNELFVTDGTTAGTHLLNDFNGSGGTPYGANFAFGGNFYFAAYDGNDGGWHTYATDGATTVKLVPGDGSSTGGAGNFIAADATHFYFTGDSGLFYSDGTSAGTTNIGSSRGFDVNTSTVANGHLLYRLYDDTNGFELWTTDGTSAGTHRVTDTLIPNSSNATGFVFSGGKVYFYADDGVHGGNELFVSDGTVAGTHLLNDFNGTGGTSYGANFAFGGKFYFAAYDGNDGGWHTYVTNGTTVTKLVPGDGKATGPAGNFMAADATHFYFTGDAGLFYSDGTDAGTYRIGDTSGFGNASVVNGHLYYQHYDSANGYELWTSDGTIAGTVRLTDTQIPNSSNPGSFAAIDNSPPTVANADTSAITDAQTVKAFQNVVIGDTDAPAQTLTVTITPDDAARGGFTAASLLASGFVGGGVGGSYTFTGTAVQATAAIDALVYRPTANRLIVGDSEEITYTIAISDGAGGSVVNRQTVITQTSVNDAPVLQTQGGAVDEDATIGAGARATGLLGNATDPDVGETAALKVTGAHAGTAADTTVAASGMTIIHGTYGDLSIAADGTYSYTPNNGAAQALAFGEQATDAFNYTVADPHGATSSTALTFTITGQEDGPVAAGDSASILENGTAAGATRAAGLLGNDTDVDHGETATLKVQGAHFGAAADTAIAASGTTTIHGTYGDLLLAADGTYSYIANSPAADALVQDASASDTFSYTIVDAQGQTSVASLTINITGQNDAPVAHDATAAVYENATAAAITRAAGVLGNATDVDTGETPSLVVSGAHGGTDTDTTVAASGTTTIHGTYGDLIIAADGTYSYTPNNAAAEALPQGAAAIDLFSITVSDPHGATTVSALTFNITGQNDAPTAQSPATASATEQTALNLKGSLSIGDVDVPTGSVTATLSVGYGILQVSPGSSGASISGAGTGTVTITGTVAQINALLGSDASSTITYFGDTDTPPGSTLLSLSVTDDHAATHVSTTTIDITPVDDAPVAINDNGGSIAETTVLNGATIFGNDYDVDGPALSITQINGQAYTIGQQIVLPSGARLTVHADGTYAYDPSGAFSNLVDPTSGAANSHAADGFTYMLAGGATASVTIDVTGVTEPGETFLGSGGADTITGTTSSEMFNLSQGGSDSVFGLDGNDSFYFGAAFDANDRVDGGVGSDRLILQGDYAAGLTYGANPLTGVEQLLLLSGSDAQFGASPAQSFSYNITLGNVALAAGQTLTVDGSGLLAGESLRFDGSAETDGSFVMTGGGGDDILIGGDQNDRLAGGAGNDTLDGGAGINMLLGGGGDDLVKIAGIASGSTLDGGTGTDTLSVSGAVTSLAGVSGFEAIQFNAGASLELSAAQLQDGFATNTTLSGNGTLVVDLDPNVALSVANFTIAPGSTVTLVANGSADGDYIKGLMQASNTLNGGGGEDFLRGGQLADVIDGGTDRDKIAGLGGADTLTGGDGPDQFRYLFVGDSTPGAGADHITDFVAGTDKIDFRLLDSDTNTPDIQLYNLTFVGSAAFSAGGQGEIHTVVSGADLLVEVDVDGNGSADMQIVLDNAAGQTLTSNDFLLDPNAFGATVAPTSDRIATDIPANITGMLLLDYYPAVNKGSGSMLLLEPTADHVRGMLIDQVAVIDDHLGLPGFATDQSIEFHHLI